MADGSNEASVYFMLGISRREVSGMCLMYSPRKTIQDLRELADLLDESIEKGDFVDELGEKLLDVFNNLLYCMKLSYVQSCVDGRWWLLANGVIGDALGHSLFVYINDQYRDDPAELREVIYRGDHLAPHVMVPTSFRDRSDLERFFGKLIKCAQGGR